MNCSVCKAYTVHEIELVDGMKLSLCRSHLFSVFRRLRRGDKAVIMFRLDEILEGWEHSRKHKDTAKVDGACLVQIAGLKCSGMNITSIAKRLNLAKSLVHRYVTKLESVHE
jgi:hypothetical protein